jgi:serine/threonine-protein kinase
VPGQFAVGSQIAGYRVMEQIGRGGMAVVYRAIDLRLDRPVALKILAPELARDEAFRHRFIRECRAAAAVDHPCIIPVFDAGEASGVLFIAMRYVSGRDVRTLLDREGSLPADRVVNIIEQVARPWTPPMRAGWSIATSSRPTCCWTRRPAAATLITST